jgi:hypothetical protein
VAQVFGTYRSRRLSWGSSSPRPAGFPGPTWSTCARRRPWFSAARGVAMFADEGGAYDELVAYFREHPA